MTFDERLAILRLMLASMIAMFGILIVVKQRRASPSKAWNDADKALLFGVIGVVLLFFSVWIIDGISILLG